MRLAILTNFWSTGKLRGDRFLFTFGAYGSHGVIVWETCFEDALNTAIDYLEEHWPGLLVSREEEAQLFKEACEEMGHALPCEDSPCEDCNKAHEKAMADFTCGGGNSGRYIASWEWSGREISRQEMKKLLSDVELSCGEIERVSA